MVQAERPKRGWDSGLDYSETYQKILSHLNRSKKPQDVVLLIQLRNGSRVGEAVEALRQFCESGKTEVYLKGKMSYTDLMNRIASALWPTGASRNDSRYVDFLHGAELANYIPKFDVQEHIKHMLEGLKKRRWFW